MREYGSFVQVDTDTGSSSLRVKGGDRLFYRSGPGGGRQIMSLPGSGLEDMRLPVTNHWAQLEFSGAALPDGDFTVTFTDAGAVGASGRLLRCVNNAPVKVGLKRVSPFNILRVA